MNVTVNMQDNFDLDATLEAVARERFAMPPEVIAAFRQAAMVSAQHLLNVVSDKETFSKLKTQDQLKVLEMVFDRAYGKSETASTSLTALHKTGQLDSGSDSHASQLSAIEKRMQRRNQRFPELASAQAARQREQHQLPNHRDRAVTGTDADYEVGPDGEDAWTGKTILPNALGCEEEVFPRRFRSDSKVVDLRRSNHGGPRSAAK